VVRPVADPAGRNVERRPESSEVAISDSGNFGRHIPTKLPRKGFPHLGLDFATDNSRVPRRSTRFQNPSLRIATFGVPPALLRFR